MVIFPAQPITDEEQIAFSRLFGPLETSPDYAGSKRTRLRDREIKDVSNLDPEGRVMSADDSRLLFNRGNQLWHTDSSFKHAPARYSLPVGTGDPADRRRDRIHRPVRHLRRASRGDET